MKKFRVVPGSTCELLLSDITRYLVISANTPIKKEFRIRAIIFLLSYSKNELSKSFIKQSLLLDWLYYTQ